MTDFEYDEDAVLREEANYQTPTIQRRRAFIREQLAPTADESVLSIGCGPGFEPAELAVEETPKQVVGIDLNPLILSQARNRCPDDLPLVQGDATSLPIADSVFDAALSVQVYEYIEDLDTALAELHRILTPTGRAIIYATDWNSLVWYAENQERTDQVLEVWNDHCAHPQLGSELRPALNSAAFTITDITPYPIFLTEIGQSSFAHYLLESIREFAAPRLGEEIAQQWADDIRTRDQHGETFFSLIQFCYVIDV